MQHLLESYSSMAAEESDVSAGLAAHLADEGASLSPAAGAASEAVTVKSELHSPVSGGWAVTGAAAAAPPPRQQIALLPGAYGAVDSVGPSMADLSSRLETLETLLANSKSLESISAELDRARDDIGDLTKRVSDLNLEIDLLKQAGSNTTITFDTIDGRLRWLEGAVQPLCGYALDLGRYMKTAGETFHAWAWRNGSIEQQAASSRGAVVVPATPPHNKEQRR